MQAVLNCFENFVNFFKYTELGFLEHLPVP